MVVELPSSMESPDSSSYISSPEVAPKRSNPNTPHKQQHQQQLGSSSPDDKEKPAYIRFLVSNAAAGSIIGKGGSTITNFQLQSGARIQLSRTNEYFPGTSDRIIMISGAVNEIIKAMELIISKLQSELHAEDGDDIDPRSKVKLIVPNSTCGGIIGKGGSTIKSFIEESQAGIKISPQDHSFAGLHDRLVIVTGSLDQQMRAVFLILSKLTEDPHYPQSVNAPFSYSGVNFSGFQSLPVGYMFPTMGAVPYNAINFGSNGTAGKFPNNKGLISPVVASSNSATDSTVLHIPDEHIGAVVGRGGRNLMEITQASGARIKISDRGDFISGTSDRKVTITGSKEAIRIAEAMIRQKAASNSDRY